MKKHIGGCAVEGCLEKYEAKGYCRSHYKRFMLHGDPLIIKRGENGTGWVSKGYKYFGKDREHRLIVEKVLGHPLPNGSVVHHVDEDRMNNANNNLVVCQSFGYHRILHARMEALRVTGHANWKKCPYCHKIDDPQNMVKEKVRFLHARCRNFLQKEIRRKNHERVSLPQSN